MNKIINTCKTIFLMTMEFLFIYLMIYLLRLINIDYFSLSNFFKTVFTTLCSIILMLIIFFMYRKDLIENLNDYKKNFKNYFTLGLKVWAIGLITMIILNNIIFLIVGQAASNEQIVQQTITNYPIYMIFSTIIYAPFIEEIIYRKSIRNIITNKWLYIIISGLLFGFIHTLSADNLSDLLYILPYGFMGSCFAYLYVKTNNIYTSICIHALHNAILLTISLIPLIIGG